MTLQAVLAQFEQILPEGLSGLLGKSLSETELKRELIPWLRDFSRNPEASLETFSRHIALALAEGKAQEAVKLRHPGLRIKIHGELSEEAFLAGEYFATQHEIDYVIYAAPAHVKCGSAKKAFVKALKENYPAQTLAQREALLTLQAIYENPLLKSRAAREQFVQARGKRLSVLSLESLQGEYTGLFWKLFGSVPAYKHIKPKKELSVKGIEDINDAWKATKQTLSIPMFSNENLLETYKQAKLDVVTKAFMETVETELLPFVGTDQEAEKIKAFLASRPYTRTAFGYTAMSEHPMNQFCARLAAAIIPRDADNPRETFWKLLYPEIQETVYAEDDSQWPDYGEALLVEDNPTQLLNYKLITKMLQADNGAQHLKGEPTKDSEDPIQDEFLKTRISKAKLSTQSLRRLYDFNRSSASKAVWQKMERPPLSARFNNFLEYFEGLQEMLRQYNQSNEGGDIDIGEQGYLAMHEYLMVMRTPEYDFVMKRLVEQSSFSARHGKRHYQALSRLKYLFTELKQRNDNRICFMGNFDMVSGALRITAIREILAGSDLSQFTPWQSEEFVVGHEQLPYPEIENIRIEVDFENADSEKIGEITTCLEQGDDRLIEMVAKQFREKTNGHSVLRKLYDFTYQIRDDARREKFLRAYFSGTENLPDMDFFGQCITAIRLHAMATGLRFKEGEEEVSLGMGAIKRFLKQLEEYNSRYGQAYEIKFKEIIPILIESPSLLAEFLSGCAKQGYDLYLYEMVKLINVAANTPGDRKILTEAFYQSGIGRLSRAGSLARYSEEEARVFLELFKDASLDEMMYFLSNLIWIKTEVSHEDIPTKLFEKIDDTVVDIKLMKKVLQLRSETKVYSFKSAVIRTEMLAYMQARLGKFVKNLDDYLNVVSELSEDGVCPDSIGIEDDKTVANIKAELLERENLHELPAETLLKLADTLIPELSNKYSDEDDLDENDISVLTKIIGSLRLDKNDLSSGILKVLFRLHNAEQKKKALSILLKNNPWLTESQDGKTLFIKYFAPDLVIATIKNGYIAFNARERNGGVFFHYYETFMQHGVLNEAGVNEMRNLLDRFNQALIIALGNTDGLHLSQDFFDEGHIYFTQWTPTFQEFYLQYRVSQVQGQLDFEDLMRECDARGFLHDVRLSVLKMLKEKIPALFKDLKNLKLARRALREHFRLVEFVDSQDEMVSVWLSIMEEDEEVDLSGYYHAVLFFADRKQLDPKKVLQDSIKQIRKFSFSSYESLEDAIQLSMLLSEENASELCKIAEPAFSMETDITGVPISLFLQGLDVEAASLLLEKRLEAIVNALVSPDVIKFGNNDVETLISTLNVEQAEKLFKQLSKTILDQKDGTIDNFKRKKFFVDSIFNIVRKMNPQDLDGAETLYAKVKGFLLEIIQDAALSHKERAEKLLDLLKRMPEAWVKDFTQTLKDKCDPIHYVCTIRRIMAELDYGKRKRFYSVYKEKMERVLGEEFAQRVLDGATHPGCFNYNYPSYLPIYPFDLDYQPHFLTATEFDFLIPNDEIYQFFVEAVSRKVFPSNLNNLYQWSVFSRNPDITTWQKCRAKLALQAHYFLHHEYVAARIVEHPSYDDYKKCLSGLKDVNGESQETPSLSMFKHDYKERIKRFESIIKLFIKHTPYARFSFTHRDVYAPLLNLFAEYDSADKQHLKYTDAYYKDLFKLDIFQAVGSDRDGDGLVYAAWNCSGVPDKTIRQVRVYNCCCELTNYVISRPMSGFQSRGVSSDLTEAQKSSSKFQDVKRACL